MGDKSWVQTSAFCSLSDFQSHCLLFCGFLARYRFALNNVLTVSWWYDHWADSAFNIASDASNTHLWRLRMDCTGVKCCICGIGALSPWSVNQFEKSPANWQTVFSVCPVKHSITSPAPASHSAQPRTLTPISVTCCDLTTKPISTLSPHIVLLTVAVCVGWKTGGLILDFRA